MKGSGEMLTTANQTQRFDCGAVVGWDPDKQTWWIECQGCGIAPQCHTDSDFVMSLMLRHNQSKHSNEAYSHQGG